MRAALAGGAALTAGIVLLAAAAEVALRWRYRRRRLPRIAPAPGRVTVVALGDSIVAGAPEATGDAAWPARLDGHLKMAYPAVAWRVVNAGRPGDTAPGGLARFAADVAAARPQLVLIAFGLNDCNPARHGMDAWLEDAVPQGLLEKHSYAWRAGRVRIEHLSRHLSRRLDRRLGCLPRPTAEAERSPIPRTSPAGFAAALEALVGRTQLIGARVGLLTMTPLAPAHTDGVRARAETYRRYNALVRKVSARRRIPLVELTAGAPADAFEPDGFHLNAAGQAWVAEQVCCQLAVAGVWERLANMGAQ